jgi:hypothetical protein
MNRIGSHLPGAALVICAVVAPAGSAQDKRPDYPNKPIRVIVGIAPAVGSTP